MQEGKGKGCETFCLSRPVREEPFGKPLFLFNMHQINWFKQSERHRDLPRAKPKRMRNTSRLLQQSLPGGNRSMSMLYPAI